MPVLADVDPVTYTLDPEQVERRITPRTRAILPVHLYGQTGRPRRARGARRTRTACCWSRTARSRTARAGDGRRAGSIGHAAAFSFYPTKNLGALGDGGAVVTSTKPSPSRRGCFGTTVSAAGSSTCCTGSTAGSTRSRPRCSRAKLPHLDGGERASRARSRRSTSERARRHAAGHARDRATAASTSTISTSCSHRIATRSGARLDEAGVGTAVQYPTPVHRQPAYRELDVAGGFPVAERLTERIVSLPLSADHTEDEITAVAEAAQSASR